MHVELLDGLALQAASELLKLVASLIFDAKFYDDLVVFLLWIVKDEGKGLSKVAGKLSKGILTVLKNLLISKRKSRESLTPPISLFDLLPTSTR